jgi:hypothetical protein
LQRLAGETPEKESFGFRWGKNKSPQSEKGKQQFFHTTNSFFWGFGISKTLNW